MAFFKLLRKSPLIARIGMAMILLNISVAILAPLIAPYGETEVVGDVWMPMSSEHLLGTDHLGRDMLTRLLYLRDYPVFLRHRD
jgi:peptide/nickel transport system permease protein